MAESIPDNTIYNAPSAPQADEPGDPSPDELEEIEAAKHKTQLYQSLSKLTPREYAIFVKLVQFKTLKQTFEAFKNMRQTPKDAWQMIIAKLKSLKGLAAAPDPSGFDFNKLIEILLPILGGVAAMMGALKGIDKAAAEHDNVKSEELDAIGEMLAEATKDSIILQMCDNNQNGFSY